MKKLIIAVLFAGTVVTAQSQQSALSKNTDKDPKISVLFGLNQPLVFRGFNFEVDYWAKKWVFEYSHGFGLKVDGKFISNTYEDQQLKFRITHSLGGGVGYRFTKNFNLRFEPKIHFYETYYDNESMKRSNSLVNFKTYTLGLGAYYRWMPFSKSETMWKGFTVAPSVRYWQKVSSSLGKDGHSYFNSHTQKLENFKAPNIGLANSPFLFNVSVGYSF